MFKTGDKVVCIDISVKEHDENSTIAQEVELFEFITSGLELGKIYTVYSELNVEGYGVQGVSFDELNKSEGNITLYMPKRFRLLTDIRKEKLNKLING